MLPRHIGQFLVNLTISPLTYILLSVVLGFFDLQLSGPPVNLFFFFNINLFILFLAALGLRCCMRAFSSYIEQGLLFVVVSGLLIAVASLVVAHGL